MLIVSATVAMSINQLKPALPMRFTPFPPGMLTIDKHTIHIDLPLSGYTQYALEH